MDDVLKEKLALGRFHYVRREYARAEQYLTQVVEGSPTFADVYNMLGVCFHDQGHYAKAQRAFEAALRLNPAYTDAALNLAITYNDTGRYREAQEVYQQALNTAGAAPGQLDQFGRGKLANMYADIGEVYLSSGLLPEAIAELRRALALCPNFVDIRARLAGALRDSGRRDEAIVEYEEVVRQNPAFVPGRLNLGLCLYAAGRVPEAADQWNEVLRISPGNHSAELYLKFAGLDPDGAPPAAPPGQER
ncbi:MAG: tetratricopeptide repeat protein [Anaeromyxobacteraceae bacterium]